MGLIIRFVTPPFVSAYAIINELCSSIYWFIKDKVSFADVPGTIGATFRDLSPVLTALTADKTTASFGAVKSLIILGGFGLDFALLKFGCESKTPPAFSAAGR